MREVLEASGFAVQLVVMYEGHPDALQPHCVGSIPNTARFRYEIVIAVKRIIEGIVLRLHKQGQSIGQFKDSAANVGCHGLIGPKGSAILSIRILGDFKPKAMNFLQPLNSLCLHAQYPQIRI